MHRVRADPFRLDDLCAAELEAGLTGYTCLSDEPLGWAGLRETAAALDGYRRAACAALCLP